MFCRPLDLIAASLFQHYGGEDSQDICICFGTGRRGSFPAVAAKKCYGGDGSPRQLILAFGFTSVPLCIRPSVPHVLSMGYWIKVYWIGFYFRPSVHLTLCPSAFIVIF